MVDYSHFFYCTLSKTCIGLAITSLQLDSIHPYRFDYLSVYIYFFELIHVGSDLLLTYRCSPSNVAILVLHIGKSIVYGTSRKGPIEYPLEDPRIDIIPLGYFYVHFSNHKLRLFRCDLISYN